MTVAGDAASGVMVLAEPDPALQRVLGQRMEREGHHVLQRSVHDVAEFGIVSLSLRLQTPRCFDSNARSGRGEVSAPPAPVQSRWRRRSSRLV